MDLFNRHPMITAAIKAETERLDEEIELIASENYPSQAILDILGSPLSVKYAEGYPEKRHYAGCENIDTVEKLAIQKACELFMCKFANVQPWSGSQANTAVYYAFDSGVYTMGMPTLSASLTTAHLTHGSKFTLSGKYFNNSNYDFKDGLIDYDDMEAKLHEVAPRLLILGYSAYTRKIDFKRVRDMVDEYNAKLLASYGDAEYIDGKSVSDCYNNRKCIIWCDMAHFAGYVASYVWKDDFNPIEHCDVITSTTHKTLRGPRGGLILWNNPDYSKRINQAVFPGIQGGPNGAAIAAKAQCFCEALTPQYKKYIYQIDRNIAALLHGITTTDTANKLGIITGGTENHMLLIDVSGAGLTGQEAENRLRENGIVVNKNMIEGDTVPSKASGIRLGVPAVTTRGYDEDDCAMLGQIIARLLLNEDTEENTVSFAECAVKHGLEKLKAKLTPFYGKVVFNTTPDGIA